MRFVRHDLVIDEPAERVIHFLTGLSQPDFHRAVAVRQFIANVDDFVSGSQGAEATPCADQRLRLYLLWHNLISSSTFNIVYFNIPYPEGFLPVSKRPRPPNR